MGFRQAASGETAERRGEASTRSAEVRALCCAAWPAGPHAHLLVLPVLLTAFCRNRNAAEFCKKQESANLSLQVWC